MNYSNINMTNCPFWNISLELKKYHIKIKNKKNIYSGLATVYKIILEINITPYKFADIIVHQFFFQDEITWLQQFCQTTATSKDGWLWNWGPNFNLRIQAYFVEESCEIEIENIQKDTHTQYKATARNFGNIETL